MQPLISAANMLWSTEENNGVIDYVSATCRNRLKAIENAGFQLLPEVSQKTETYANEGCQYLIYRCRVARGTDRISDVLKEVWERSKLLISGKRSVPQDLFGIMPGFMSEALVLRAFSAEEERFRTAMLNVVPF